MAKIVSPNRSATPIKEGSEPDGFWAALGGKGPVSKHCDEAHRPILDPRLFHCKISEMTGKFRAFEIFNFKQDVRKTGVISILYILTNINIIMALSSSVNIFIVSLFRIWSKMML